MVLRIRDISRRIRYLQLIETGTQEYPGARLDKLHQYTTLIAHKIHREQTIFRYYIIWSSLSVKVHRQSFWASAGADVKRMLLASNSELLSCSSNGLLLLLRLVAF